MSTGDSYFPCMSRLRILISTVENQMTSAQSRYKRDFEEPVRIPRNKFNPCSQVFI